VQILAILLKEYQKVKSEDKDKKHDAVQVKKYSIKPTYFTNMEGVEVDEKMLQQHMLLFVRDEIPYNHLAEITVIDFVKTFRSYKNMSIARIKMGVKLLNEAIRLQMVEHNRSKLTPNEKTQIRDRLQTKLNAHKNPPQPSKPKKQEPTKQPTQPKGDVESGFDADSLWDMLSGGDSDSEYVQ